MSVLYVFLTCFTIFVAPCCVDGWTHRGIGKDNIGEDEDYIPGNDDDYDGQEVAEPSDSGIPDSKNEVTMNTIGDAIANALVSGA
jgi:hypothetical protein